MSAKLKVLALLILLIFPFLAAHSSPVKAFSLFNNCVTEPDGTQVCGPCTKNSATPTCQSAASQGNTDPIAGPNGVIHTAATIVALIAGVGALIMIILGGFFYITSAGNAEQAASARRRIIAGIVGLVIVALAWTIVTFISDKIIH